MKQITNPTSLVMVSALLAGAAAGITPALPTFVKSVLAPSAPTMVPRTSTAADASLQIVAPVAGRPLVFHTADGVHYSAYAQVRNLDDKTRSFEVAPLLQSVTGAPLLPDPLLSLPAPPLAPHSTSCFEVPGHATLVQEVPLSLPQEKTAGPRFFPATGTLRFRTYPTDCKSRDLKSAPTYIEGPIGISETPPGKRQVAEFLFAGSLLIVLIIAVVTAVNLHRKKIGLLHSMGSASWSFERSWGVNVTVGGALFVTLLGLTVFPDVLYWMSKSSYSMLQLLFGALVALAPLVYNLIRRDVEVNSGGGTVITNQGYVITFLISGGLVLWAALGQVATLGVLVQEFVLGGTLGALTGWSLEAVVFMLFLLLVVYGFRALYLTARNQSVARSTASMPPFGPRAAAPANLPSPLREWSLL